MVVEVMGKEGVETCRHKEVAVMVKVEGVICTHKVVAGMEKVGEETCRHKEEVAMVMVAVESCKHRVAVVMEKEEVVTCRHMSYSKLGSFELDILIVGYSSLEEETLGFFVLQLSAPKDNRWCFVLSYSDDKNFECLGLLRFLTHSSISVDCTLPRFISSDSDHLLRLIILCSWKSIGGAIDSFTVTTFDANHCPEKMQENEPGKQVKSAVRLSNTSKYHVAFKISDISINFIATNLILISPASIVAKMNGQDSICKADLEEVTSLYHDRCIIMKKGGYWVAVFVLPTEWTDQFESGIQTIAVIQAGHGLLQLGSCKIVAGNVIIIMACYELESQFLYLSFSLVSSLPVESLSVLRILLELPKDKWFCCDDYSRIHIALQNLVSLGLKIVPASLCET
ncbi:hypothetical protein G4B88_020666 [Cannabis sativa]|uniref:Uncharacterized protein n=1 Tax=Cannabis sativa TaxID=3483 RepID=A0A7J6HMX0_CANSA|nr:hypothetical protein G4B88_020666 [Cannabis sativa]